ncbi:hypothetical protein VB779_14010 [Haloarculaceae archaeon H-GB11]|nr:hypothetical protein [Haloarculaceae archaeon H-GB11]
MQLSIREVVQLSQRCFAAADLPRGLAAENGTAIWWEQLYRGTGLRTLHGLLDDLEEWDRSQLTRTDDSAPTSVIDGGSQPSLLSSTPALDLCSAHADRHGVGMAHASIAAGDETLSLLGHTAFRAAERGLLPVVSYADPEGGSGTVLGVPDEPYPRLAEATFDSPPRSYVELAAAAESGAHQSANAPLTQVFFDGPEDSDHAVDDERLLARLLGRATEPSQRSHQSAPGYVLVCLDPTHPRHSCDLRQVVEQYIDEHAADFSTVFEPDAIADRLETLMETGVEVERNVWEDVYEYNTGVLTPSFEGSERGAGADIL